MRGWILVSGAIAGVLLLKWQFPYALTQPGEQMRLVYLLLVLMLVGGSGLIGRMTLSQGARDALWWGAIVALLVLGYGFRGELPYQRFMSTIAPSRIQTTDEGGMSIQLSDDGHFHIEGEVNGVLLEFLIDTGASDIVLSPKDADAAGYEVETLNYTRHYSTANGGVQGAPVKIDTLALGPFTLRDVPASVNSVNMESSLLGMAFLKQFREYKVSGDTLTLYP